MAISITITTFKNIGIYSLAILPNSNIVSIFDKTIKIWQSESPYDSIATLDGHSRFVFALAILPNSNIVSGSQDDTIKIWQSVSPFKCIATLYGHKNYVQSLAKFKFC